MRMELDDVLLLVAPTATLVLLGPVLFLVAHFQFHRARILRNSRSSRSNSLLHAGVISLSPASHSPRALNHVTALVNSGKFTACFHACPPFPPLHMAELVSFIPVGAFDRIQRSDSFMRNAMSQAIHLYNSLVSNSALRKYDVIIVNTPPCIPTFAVVWVAARFVHGCPVIVDWHNFAYSIMQSTGKSRGLVRVAKVFEWALGRAMQGHFCVSRAMKEFLADKWGIDAHVLYDRPPLHFRRIDDMVTRHQLFRCLHECSGKPYSVGIDETVATYVDKTGSARNRDTRPALIMSSTSWTPDEDFSLLLRALELLDIRLSSVKQGTSAGIDCIPFSGRVLCVLTGKGPLRSSFEAAVAEKSFTTIDVWFAWLPMEQYPQLLGCSDLGISLHISSSALDLPMKVVDMFGCGLPVLSYAFDCIEELVQVGKTGLLFHNAEELSEQIFELLFTEDGAAQRRQMSDYIVTTFSSESMRWQAGWEREAFPVLSRICTSFTRQVK